MDAGEGEPIHVVATYREIASHFGLKGPDQGRTKAKRAGWPTEPQNHPADPVRVRVPAEVWEGALAARERGASERGGARAGRALSLMREEAPIRPPRSFLSSMP